MKKLLILLSAFILFSLSTNAQAWMPGHIGITLGGDIEMPHGLGHKYLLSTASDIDFDTNELPFEDGELVSMDCDNGTFRFSMSIIPLNQRKVELLFSLLSIDGRIDKVHYQLPEEGHFAEVSAVNKEIALEGVYLFKTQTNRTFSFHGGLGTNVGYSHSGEVNIKGFFINEAITDSPDVAQDIDITFDQKDSFNQRLFLQGGVGIRFLRRMEFGLNFRKGLGYRASFGGPFNFTTLKSSVGLSLNYQL